MTVSRIKWKRAIAAAVSWELREFANYHGALNKWVLGLLINTQTPAGLYSNAGKKPNSWQGAMADITLNSAVVFSVMDNDKKDTEWFQKQGK